MPRRPSWSTLFPYTTLFRSHAPPGCAAAGGCVRVRRVNPVAGDGRRHAPFCLSPRRKAKGGVPADRKSTRLNSSHVEISYAVFCLKKKKKNTPEIHTTDRTE